MTVLPRTRTYGGGDRREGEKEEGGSVSMKVFYASSEGEKEGRMQEVREEKRKGRGRK